GSRIASARRSIGTLQAAEVDPNVDVIPADVWEHVCRKSLPSAGITTRRLAERLGMQYCGSTLYKHGVSRRRMERLADITGDPWLADLATSDVLWDEIIGIQTIAPH